MSKPCAFQANSLQQVLLHGSGADTRVCRVETRLDLLRAARAPRRVSALQTRVSAPQGYATLFRRLSVATRTYRLQPVVISRPSFSFSVCVMPGRPSSGLHPPTRGP